MILEKLPSVLFLSLQLYFPHLPFKKKYDTYCSHESRCSQTEFTSQSILSAIKVTFFMKYNMKSIFFSYILYIYVE